jgi:hypothetical protein
LFSFIPGSTPPFPSQLPAGSTHNEYDIWLKLGPVDGANSMTTKIRGQLPDCFSRSVALGMFLD